MSCLFMADSSETPPFSHVIASRDGLFLAARHGFAKVAEGLFFGVTVRGGHVYAFEAGDQPWVTPGTGRIVRFTCDGMALLDRHVLAEGLDNGCHQIDFIDDQLWVIDTYNQQILSFDTSWRKVIHRPIPAARYGKWGDGYVHMNAILAHGDLIYLLLHKGGKVGPSEVVVVDRALCEQGRIELPGFQCHDLAMLETGRLLSCHSPAGSLIDSGGEVAQIDSLLTRGLSVGVNEIAVGSSLFGARPVRNLIPGFVTFLDRDYQRLARLHLPAAPTQIRRLDGQDLAMSAPGRIGS
jgi:hypothetical protein